MHGQATEVIGNRRGPPIVLCEVDGKRRFAATVGRKQLIDALGVDGAGLRFSPVAGTLMACPESAHQ